ncbi:MAG TPA: hypothetical protein VFT37_15215 [Telluria sp.]|nr:hypothetical protein [Telluria sp.]
MKTLAFLLAAALLAGCASAPVEREAGLPAYLMADARFAAPSEPVDTSTLFTLSPAMHAYLHTLNIRNPVRDKSPQRRLAEALYKEGELRLDYDASVTHPAAATFERKSGNCLSLVIMTAAFAKEMGFRVTFQEVRVEETWSREGALYLANTHVNVVLGRRSDASRPAWEFTEGLLVDFLPPEDAATHKSQPIGEHAIVAMYANNRAAEALAQGRVSDAYWWARKAIETDPAFDMAYNTLGVVYQRHGDNAMAEKVFTDVLTRAPDNRIVLRNLVPVLEALDKRTEADQVRARLAALDPTPPFHYFQLGQAAMARNQFREARDLFAREIARAPYYHEFHFWHAMASLRLGDDDSARKDLARAIETSGTADSRARYSAKLDHMRRLLPRSTRR